MILRVKGFTKVIILYQRLGNFPLATGCVLVVYMYTVHRIQEYILMPWTF